MKKLLIALIVLFVPSLTLAATIKSGDSIEINADDKNPYVFSQSANLTSDLTGDVVFFGQSINVNKNIEQSLFAFAQSVDVSGNIGQSIRSGGNAIIISGTVGEDVLVGANSLTITESSNIKGDLVAGGATININGTVNGDTRIAGAKVVVSGSILGDVDIHANELIVEDAAAIGGTLSYWSEKEGRISPDAKITGGTKFNQVKTDYAQVSSAITYALLSILVFALAIAYGLKRFSAKIKEHDATSFLKNFGWGILSIAAIPIVGFILFAISLHLAFFILIAYVLSLVLAYGVSAIYTGVILRKALAKEKTLDIDWVTVLIGGFAFVLVGYIPYIGSTVQALVFITSFGYIMNKAFAIINPQSAQAKSSK